MEKFKQIFATGVLLTFGFVVISATAFAAVPELPSPFGDSGSIPEIEPADNSDSGLPALEVAPAPTVPALTPKTPTPTPTPSYNPPPTTPAKIVKTGPELAYLLVPSLALGYIYSRRKKQI